MDGRLRGRFAQRAIIGAESIADANHIAVAMRGVGDRVEPQRGQ